MQCSSSCFTHHLCFSPFVQQKNAWIISGREIITDFFRNSGLLQGPGYFVARGAGTHGDVLNLHTEVFWTDTRGRGEEREGGRGEGEERAVTVSSPHLNLHIGLSRASERFTESNHWILQISSLRIGREQHVPDSSNLSRSLIKLFSFSCPQGHCGGNDKHNTHPPTITTTTTSPSLLSLPHT